jgi:hypothetical protein
MIFRVNAGRDPFASSSNRNAIYVKVEFNSVCFVLFCCWPNLSFIAKLCTASPALPPSLHLLFLAARERIYSVVHTTHAHARAQSLTDTNGGGY